MYNQAVRNSQKIINVYYPCSYNGRVDVFRAREENHEGEPTLGWGRLSINSLNIHDVPGNHATMLLEPNVGELARSVSICLEGISESFRDERSS